MIVKTLGVDRQGLQRLRARKVRRARQFQLQAEERAEYSFHVEVLTLTRTIKGVQRDRRYVRNMEGAVERAKRPPLLERGLELA
jgi:hypothetical protein